LAKDTSVASQQRPCTDANALATRFLLIAVAILVSRKLARYDGGKRVPATVSAIADAVPRAEEIMAEIDWRFSIGQK
jgi:hypothetical protein